MNNTFLNILSAHLTRYPLMEPQDVMKLCFQSEFGPEHMVTDAGAVEQYLLREWQAISPDTPAKAPEDIGSGLVRFHLTGEYAPEAAAPLLARLFCLTAKQHRGCTAGLEEKLRFSAEYLQKNRKLSSDFAAYTEQCRKNGYPAVHHSQRFRTAYAPHYRLLSRDLALYFPLLSELYDGGIVAIDGSCGSGKTHLAEIIAQVFDCNVFHMDDYYLPLSQRQTDWQTIPGGNMDFSRLKQQVLEPLRRGEAVTTCSYSCRSGSFGPDVTCSPKALTILEGSYSHHPALSGYFDKKIYLTCDKETQLRRLSAREGDYVSAFQKLWIPMEERYHGAYPPDEHTLMVDTSSYFL